MALRSGATGLLALLACLLSIASVGCDAVPSELMPPTASEAALFKTYQPNGKEIQLYYRGDVRFSWYEDAAGYTVLRESGAYYYATLDANGELTVTKWPVGSVDPSQKGLSPGILPSPEVISRLQAAADVRPISEAEPDLGLIPAGFMVVEGDMVLPTTTYEEMKVAASASVYVTNRLWPGGVVPYTFDANVSAGYQAAMRQAMDDWEAIADIQFVARTSQANYVHIFSGSGNWSYVGMIGGRQDLCIYNWNYEFIMAHELAHALGYWHEHSRSDRDSFVQINWGNIQAGKENNFDLQNAWNDADVGSYDFDSVMHYSAYSFSSNGQPTISCQPAYAGTSFGQRTHLSLGDAQNMATIYGSSVPTDKAEMTTPANNGDSLTGATFTFEWDAGSGVTEYWMWIGSQPNTYNMLNQSQGLNLSKTVTGLPTDGRSLYVRVFSL
ncbi:MAG: M12 family metallopeptidase, partial [Planctomycetota bacterium]